MATLHGDSLPALAKHEKIHSMKRWGESFLLSMQILQRRLGVFVGIQFLSFSLRYSSELNMQSILSGQAPHMVWMVGFETFSFFMQFLLSLFSIYWICEGYLSLKHPSQNSLLLRPQFYFEQLVIEELRVYGGLIWRLPFLFIWSLWKWFAWFMVTPIVLLDRQYLLGSVSALKASEKLFSSHKWTIIRLALTLVLLPQVAQWMVLGDTTISSNLLGYSLYQVVDMIVEIWLGTYFLLIYLHLRKLEPENRT